MSINRWIVEVEEAISKQEKKIQFNILCYSRFFVRTSPIICALFVSIFPIWCAHCTHDISTFINNDYLTNTVTVVLSAMIILFVVHIHIRLLQTVWTLP